jgi:hypothetical protein
MPHGQKMHQSMKHIMHISSDHIEGKRYISILHVIQKSRFCYQYIGILDAITS